MMPVSASVFEVVQDQQQPAIAEVSQQRVDGVARLAGRHAHRLRDGAHRQAGRVERLQRDEEDLVVVGVDQARAGLEGQTGLADPARPSQCQQAAGRVAQPLVDRS